MPNDNGLRTRRERAVHAHLDAENSHDVEATVTTFHHPRYEVAPLGVVSDGPAAVRELATGLFRGFPDLRIHCDKLHHADDAVIVEGKLDGTHAGPWAGVEATGRRMDVKFVAIFDFDDDRLMCEKVFFDLATMLRQLGKLP